MTTTCRQFCMGLALLPIGASLTAMTADAAPSGGPTAMPLVKTDAGEYRCATPHYEAIVDASGSLRSLKAGGTEFLGMPTAFAGARGRLLPTQRVRQTAPDTLVAEGENPEVVADGNPAVLCVTYRFLADHIELSGASDPQPPVAWIPSASVIDSRDGPTDFPYQPASNRPALYGQTTPRWTTREGAMLRFDFGVAQRGFANTYWQTFNIDGRQVPFFTGKTVRVYPLAQPAPGDALTFDITCTNPDFLLPGDAPVHFDIRVRNAGAVPAEAALRFEVRDYLTRKTIASKTTRATLAQGGELALPTDVPLVEPGPYLAAIVVEDAGKVMRDLCWRFVYDFARYAPATTRPPDFAQFWKDALQESAALPLDLKMTHVPEKSTERVEAFKINFATLGGRRIYGWYARPKAAGKYPGRIRYPSSGIYPLQGPEQSEDRCSLWIQIHGFDVDLANMPAGADPGKNYWTAGLSSPQTAMWRTIYVSLVRAVDFILSQPEVDSERLGVFGGSQGGGLALVAAALDPRIKFCQAFHIGLPRLDWTVTHQTGYWPFGMDGKVGQQSDEEFLRTLAYFDAANFTPDIRCPVAAEVGLMDTVTAAGNQICALAHVPKRQLLLVCSPWALHGGGSRDARLTENRYRQFLEGQ